MRDAGCSAQPGAAPSIVTLRLARSPRTIGRRLARSRPLRSWAARRTPHRPSGRPSSSWRVAPSDSVRTSMESLEPVTDLHQVVRVDVVRLQRVAEIRRVGVERVDVRAGSRSARRWKPATSWSSGTAPPASFATDLQRFLSDFGTARAEGLRIVLQTRPPQRGHHAHRVGPTELRQVELLVVLGSVVEPEDQRDLVVLLEPRRNTASSASSWHPPATRAPPHARPRPRPPSLRLASSPAPSLSVGAARSMSGIRER
jgi:hypothetical protein